jgi:hypothetical protein
MKQKYSIITPTLKEVQKLGGGQPTPKILEAREAFLRNVIIPGTQTFSKIDWDKLPNDKTISSISSHLDDVSAALNIVVALYNAGGARTDNLISKTAQRSAIYQQINEALFAGDLTTIETTCRRYNRAPEVAKLEGDDLLAHIEHSMQALSLEEEGVLSLLYEKLLISMVLRSSIYKAAITNRTAKRQ